MSVAKVRSSNSSDAVKFEGHSSFDNFITQITRREPFLSFTPANDPGILWYQLLSAFEQSGSNNMAKGQKLEAGMLKTSVDQCNTFSSLGDSSSSGTSSGSSTKVTKSAVEMVPSLKIPEAVVAFAQAAAKANGEPEKYLAGWPLLSPSKIQLQKCTKCSREFYSSINYKRHIRTHRKSNIHEKVSPNTREFLAAFWDKISIEEAKNIVSLKDTKLVIEGVAAASVIAELSSWTRKPGFSCLPQVCVKAGITLLDVIQTNPPSFPISSHELFNLLDDASEKTFLCAGITSSLQKFLFDGNSVKTALDMKNLVACTSLLLEQALVKAWHADKDAEAFRCQKLLVQEEEAAQKRRAELTERKRRKKLRQKEQKAKDLANGNVSIKDSSQGCGSNSFVELSMPRDASDAELDSEASSTSCQLLMSNPVFDPKVETDEGHSPDSFSDQNIDNQYLQHDCQRDIRKISNSQNSLNAFRSSTRASLKNSKTVSSNGVQKIWTRKIKHDSQEISADIPASTDIGMVESQDAIGKPAFLIGTISISLGNCADSNNVRTPQSDLSGKFDMSVNHGSQSMVKLWRPVNRQGNIDSPSQSCKVESNDAFEEATRSFDTIDISNEATISSLSDNSPPSSDVGDDNSSIRTDTSPLDSTESSTLHLFSSQIAEAFLRQRWEEAIASDHVKLILTLDAESMDCSDTKEVGDDLEGGAETPYCRGHEDNNVPGQKPANTGVQETKLKPKMEVCNVEFVHKQKTM